MALRFEDVRLSQAGFRMEANLSVREHCVTAILGPSGAGKSTLLSAVAGFLRPDAGRILWRGKSLNDLSPGDRPVSVIFQDNNLFPHLTVWQNVGVGLSPSLRLNPQDTARIEDGLTRVGLDGFAKRRPSELSGGQQSRVALARVLVRRQPLILLDEPFAALGPSLRDEMLQLVGAVARDLEATVLMVTHDPVDARAAARDTVLVAGGVAHPPQPTAALLADPPPALAEYLGMR